MLGLLAAQAGAGRVYAVDAGADSRAGDRRGQAVRARAIDSCIVRDFSTELNLPEQVDVIVCDQIGGFVHDAGILGYYEDAVERFLKPGGVLVPASFSLWLTPVDDPELAARVADWRAGPVGLDFGPFAEAAANTEHRVNAPASCALGPDVVVTEIASDHNRHFGGSGRLAIERPGRVCGLLGTFVAQMSPSVTLTNAPWAEHPMKRWQNFYPFAKAVDVAAGDHIDASIDVSPKTGMVAWRGTIIHTDGSPPRSFAHDTLRGRFAGPASIIRASDKWTPAPTERVELAREVLESLDGASSVERIAEILLEGNPSAFVSPAHARSFVRSVIGPVVDHSAD